MKLKHFLASFLVLFTLASCGDNNSSSSEQFEETATWNVSYYYNYEGNDSVYKTVSTVNNGLASKPSDPTREGYVFDNWYKDSYCKIAFDFEKDTITANTSLYASWVEKVSYNITWSEVKGVTYTSVDETDLPVTAYTNDEVSFKLELETEGYEGEAVVKVNNQEITSNDGIYTFKVTSNTTVTVTGYESIVKSYTIMFTLPVHIFVKKYQKI